MDRAFAESEKTALPVPANATVCAPPPALLATVSAPVTLPLEVGEKVMLMLQPSPTFRTLGNAPQVLLSAKLPLMVMLDKITEAWPVFDNRTICAGLVLPTVTAGKVTLEGVKVNDPREDATPFPVTVIFCGLPPALSVMVISSVRFPMLVGVNVTWIEQLPPPAGTLPPQLLVWEKSPLAEMVLILRGELPALIKVTGSGALVVLSD